MANREMTLNGIEVVGVDWDGTVVDSVPGKIRQNRALAEKFGRKLSYEEVRQMWNDSSDFNDLMLNLTDSDDTEKIMAAVREDYFAPEYEKLRFIGGLQAVERFRGLGKRTALITNLNREMLSEDAARLTIDLDDYFDCVQTTDDSRYRKPDSRVLDPVLEKFDIMPHQLLYVGDEVKDAMTVRYSGARFLGVETGMASRSDFVKIGAGCEQNLGEIARLMEELENGAI